MREFLGVVYAFLARDAALATSYRLSFLMRVFGSVAKVLVLWLPAQLLAENALFRQQGGFIAFSLVGMSMMTFFMVSYESMAGSIRGEQAMGTLEALLMSPVSVTSIVVGSNLWSLTYAMADSLLILGVGKVVFGLSLRGDALLALAIVFLTSLSFAAIGILSAAFIVVFKRGDPFRVLVGGASFLIGGVIYPVEILPSWIVTLSRLLPITHGAKALRQVVLHGKGASAIATELVFLAGFAAITLPSAIVCFALAIQRAKRDGSLTHY